MNNYWQDGKLVLRIRVTADSGYPDRLLLQPLGVAVTGPGAVIVVPGKGHIDIRDIGREGVPVDFGQVEVTGPRVRELLDEVARSQPDMEVHYSAGFEGIVVADVGSEVTDDLLDAFRVYTDASSSSLLADL